MGQITESRVAAGKILNAVSRGRRLDLAFRDGASGLPARDRRFLQELCYGTVRLRGRLDYLLDLHLKKGVASLSPELLNLVRQGAYQILYMDGVPSYAAISQTVDQARELAGQGGARLVNAVLRSLDREGGHLSRFPSFQEDPLAHLSTWGSHPQWLVRRWLRRWGPDEVARLVERNNLPAPIFFRPLGLSLEEARGRLAARGLETSGAGPGVPCLRLENGTDPAQVLQWVPGIVQDPGAALVSEYAAFSPGETVVDLCAAPGGKALAMAQSGVYVLAADRSLRRLRLLKENLSRLGGRMSMVVALAQAPPFTELPSALLDVPCGGTGTLRRHPDARWRLREDTIQRLAQVQREILDHASRLVPVGGTLVYSTCTLEPEENQEQVESFLERNRDFFLAPPDGVASEYLDENGYLSITPQANGFDGAFAARMVRGT